MRLDVATGGDEDHTPRVVHRSCVSDGRGGSPWHHFRSLPGWRRYVPRSKTRIGTGLCLGSEIVSTCFAANPRHKIMITLCVITRRMISRHWLQYECARSEEGLGPAR